MLKKSPEAKGSDRPRTVLVVDDDEGIRRLLTLALSREGWKVSNAASGYEALDWIQKNFADILLLDLKLADINAKSLLESISKIGREIPFIIITGQGDERVAVEMMKLGAVDYIVKTQDFLEVVPAIVGKALKHLEQKSLLAQTEASLVEKEDQLTVCVRHAPAAIAMFDREMRYLAVSDRWCRDFRLSDQSVLGRSHYEVFPQIPEHWKETYGRCLSGATEKREEEQIVRTDGTQQWLRWEICPWKTARGTVGGIVIFAEDITERKRMQQALVDVSERERRQFGRELHDGLGQCLTGLELLSHALAEDLKAYSDQLAARATRLNEALRDTVSQTRCIARGLAPVPQNGEGLMQGLAELASRTSHLPGVHCEFVCDPPVIVDDSVIPSHLYRIAQEAVNNALKHGRAQNIAISLSADGGSLKLSVENDGQPLSLAKDKPPGMGLSVMRYRAEMVGGSISILPLKPKGIRLTCILPTP